MYTKENSSNFTSERKGYPFEYSLPGEERFDAKMKIFAYQKYFNL